MKNKSIYSDNFSEKESRFKTVVRVKGKKYSISRPRLLGKTIHESFSIQLRKECSEANIRVTSAGWPDCLLIVNGKIVLVEIKTGKDHLSPIQKRVYDLLTSKGIPYFIYRGQKGFIDTVLKLVE